MNALQRYAIAAVIVLLAVLGIYRYGFHNGWSERDAEMQIAIAKANEQSRATEQKLTEQINSHANKLQEANHALDEKQSALDRAIRAGRVRLPAPGCVPAAQSPAPAAGDRNQAPSQPDRPTDSAPGADDAERATLAAIAEIVAQGDRNTQQLNACIDAYNQVREQLNGHR